MSEPGFTWGDYVSWRERAKDAETRAEAAEAELEHWKGANLYPVTYRDAVEENIRLARQVADLEAALQEIEDSSPNWMVRDAVAENERWMRDRAHDALARSRDPQEGA